MRRVALLVMMLIPPLTAAAADDRVSVAEVQDYVFGGYAGDFPSPPHADLNPKRALIAAWAGRPYRLVFSHEGSYCPWFEFATAQGGSGAGVCWQFFEGNDGWAELFNDHGRKERNSFVDVVDRSLSRVWIRWTYFGVNMQSGAAAYRATEDFWCCANGLVLRRQRYESLMPNDPHGYAREPIEMIGMCPVGRTWRDVLRVGDKPDERHALTLLDAFSAARYDVYWTPKASTVWDSIHRRAGNEWKQLDDAKGVALVLPLRDGLAFCAFGDASGFGHEFTKLKEHTFKDTGGNDWGSSSWDHWPIGWLNSQAHVVDADSVKKYPNHFSPMGMDFFALPNEQVAGRDFWSLYGVGRDAAEIRSLARQWLESRDPSRPDNVAQLTLPR